MKCYDKCGIDDVGRDVKRKMRREGKEGGVECYDILSALKIP